LQNNELGNEERIHTALFRTTGCNVQNNLLLHNCSLKEKNYNQAKRVILDLCNKMVINIL